MLRSSARRSPVLGAKRPRSSEVGGISGLVSRFPAWRIPR